MAEEMEREVNYNADHFVTRYEIDRRHAYEREISDQRLEIANLKAEKISDAKDIEVYKQVQKDIDKATDPLKCEIGHLKGEIEHLKNKAAEQAVWNTAQQAALHGLRSDVDDLLRLTHRYIPRRYIMPPIEDAPEP